jgi:hypothetical protein
MLNQALYAHYPSAVSNQPSGKPVPSGKNEPLLVNVAAFELGNAAFQFDLAAGFPDG